MLLPPIFAHRSFCMMYGEVVVVVVWVVVLVVVSVVVEMV
jgi:hypothetical protein